jgi:hypothetical protein
VSYGSCLADDGGPTFPFEVFDFEGSDGLANATTLRLTYFFSGCEGNSLTDPVWQWKEALMKLIHNYNDPVITAKIIDYHTGPVHPEEN